MYIITHHVWPSIMISSKYIFIFYFYYKWHVYIYFSGDEKENRQKSQVQNESISGKLIPSSTVNGMDHEEFRRRGKEMIDYIADYLNNIGFEMKKIIISFGISVFIKIIVNVV
jgi:hypothetical protein